MRYKANPKSLFDYNFGHDEDMMNHCSGIVAYQSTFMFSDEGKLRNRMTSAVPISDMQPAQYQLLIKSSETQFLTDLNALIVKKNEDGSLFFDQKSILLQDTLE